MPILSKTASTLGEVLDATSAMRKSWNPSYLDDAELWFRGHEKQQHELLPGQYRPHVLAQRYDEYSLMSHFKNLAQAQNSRPLSLWDWYILAQHYGLPTRLLDWTEGLLTSVYFALEPHVRSMSKKQYDDLLRGEKQPPIYDNDSPTIWVLEAGSLNLWATKQLGVFSLGEEGSVDIDGYCWNKIHAADSSCSRPIAVQPPWTNPRIVAQRGMFTLHGTESVSIDMLATDHDPKGKIKLGKIVLNRSNIAGLWEELETTGIGRLGLFPDLENIVAHIKWVQQSY